MTVKSKLHKVNAILKMRKIRESRAGREFFVAKVRLNENQEAIVQKDAVIRGLLESEVAGLAPSAVINPSLLRERAGYVALQHSELAALTASGDRHRIELEIRRKALISASIRKRLFEKISTKLSKQLDNERLKVELANR